MMRASCLDDQSARCGPVEPRSKHEVKSTTCEEFLHIMKEFSESSCNAKEMAQRVDSLVHQDQTLLRLFPTTPSRNEGHGPESHPSSIVTSSETKTRNVRNVRNDLLANKEQPAHSQHGHEDLAEWMELDLEFEQEMDHFDFHLHLDSPQHHDVTIPPAPATATARSTTIEPTTSPFMKQQAATSHAHHGFFFKANHLPRDGDKNSNNSKHDQEEDWTLFRKSRLCGLDTSKDKQQQPLSINTQVHQINSNSSTNSQVRHAQSQHQHQQQSVTAGSHDLACGTDNVKAKVSPLFGHLDLSGAGNQRNPLEKPTLHISASTSTTTTATPSMTATVTPTPDPTQVSHGNANGSSSSMTNSRRNLSNLHALQTSEKISSRSSTVEPEDDDEANVWGMEDDEYEQNLLDSIDHTVLCDRENRFLQWDLELSHGSSNSTASKSSRSSDLGAGARVGTLFSKNSSSHHAANVPRSKTTAFLGNGSHSSLHTHPLARKSKSCSSFSPRDKLNKSPSTVEIDLDFGTFQNRTVSHILSSCLHKRKLHHPYKNQVKLVNFHIPSASNQINAAAGVPGTSPHAASEGRGSLATSLAFGTQENEFHHALGPSSTHIAMATSSIASMTANSSSSFCRGSDLLSPFGMTSESKTKSSQTNEMKSKKREERKRMMSQKLQETLAEFEATFTEQELDFKRSSGLAANSLMANGMGMNANQLSKMALSKLENLPLPDLTNLPQDLKELKRKIEMTEHKVEGTKHRHRKGGPCPRCQVQNQLRAAKRAYHKRAVAHKKLPQSAAALASAVSAATSAAAANSANLASPGSIASSIAASHATIPRTVTPSPSPPPTPATTTLSPTVSPAALAVPAATVMVTPSPPRAVSATSVAMKNKVASMMVSTATPTTAAATQSLMMATSFSSTSVPSSASSASSAQVLGSTTVPTVNGLSGASMPVLATGGASAIPVSSMAPVSNDSLLAATSDPTIMSSPTSSDNIDLSPLEITEDPAVRAVLEMEENDELLDVPLSPTVDAIPGVVASIESLALPGSVESRNNVVPTVAIPTSAGFGAAPPPSLSTAAAAVAASISAPMASTLQSHGLQPSAINVVRGASATTPVSGLPVPPTVAYSSAESTAPSSSSSAPSSTTTSSASTPSASPSQLQQHVTVTSG